MAPATAATAATAATTTATFPTPPLRPSLTTTASTDDTDDHDNRTTTSSSAAVLPAHRGYFDVDDDHLESHKPPHPYPHPPHPAPLSLSPHSAPLFCTHPFSPTREHFRDISLGPLTLHRLFLLLYLVGFVTGVHFLQNWIWPPSTLQPISLLWTLFSLISLVPIPGVIAWLLGAFIFYYPSRSLDTLTPIAYPVVFRIVSRGTNAHCLMGTIRNVQAIMRKHALFPYLVEVVTDGACFQAPCDADVLHTVVPDHYNTPTGTRFKARALHYACRHSSVPGTAWVMHLDEESHVTGSVVKGIAKMVAASEREGGNVNRIGQGMILYHRNWKSHPLLTLADMRRTGDDVGQFHLQHRVGLCAFGLHGSFVVVRQDVEASIGFDVGPEGSITEDSWWVLLAMEKGIRTTWVEGYVEEQSTQSVTDFLKQRRRWYVGLWKVTWKCPVKWYYRALLAVNVFSWIIMPIALPLQVAYVVFSIILQKQIVTPIRIFTSVIFAVSAAVYLTGLVVNMREHGTPWYRGVMWMCLQIILFPVFQALEFVAIVMVFFSPLSQNAKGFHVVVKSGDSEDEGARDLEEGVESDSSTDVGDSGSEKPARKR